PWRRVGLQFSASERQAVGLVAGPNCVVGNAVAAAAGVGVAAAAGVALAGEGEAVDHHLGRLPLVAVVVGPVAVHEASVDQEQRPLRRVLPERFGLLPP